MLFGFYFISVSVIFMLCVCAVDQAIYPLAFSIFCMCYAGSVVADNGSYFCGHGRGSEH